MTTAIIARWDHVRALVRSSRTSFVSFSPFYSRDALALLSTSLARTTPIEFWTRLSLHDWAAGRQFLRRHMLEDKHHVADTNLPRPAVGQVNRLGRHLRREAQPVGRRRAGRHEAGAGPPRQRRGD